MEIGKHYTSEQKKKLLRATLEKEGEPSHPIILSPYIYIYVFFALTLLLCILIPRVTAVYQSFQGAQRNISNYFIMLIFV